MYRVVFNHKSCQWEIQLLKYGFFWCSLVGKEFCNHASALDYVKAVGLDEVYRPYGKSFMHMLLSGDAV